MSAVLLDAPVDGAYHLVSALVALIEPVAGSLAVAAAIVLFTVAIRLLLHPLSRAAVRGERGRADLMPRIAELRAKHPDDPERLRAEVARLQAESGSSLFAGCLPMLAQLPVFWLMYKLFTTATVAGAPNALLAGSLFGAPLGTAWPLVTATPVFGVLAVLLALVAWFTVRWQARRTAGLPAAPGAALLRLLPFGTVATAAVLPLAAGLYLLTTTTWTVLERALLYRTMG
jgi:YidC/Oxa1 family membrane protein insertase